MPRGRKLWQSIIPTAKSSPLRCGNRPLHQQLYLGFLPCASSTIVILLHEINESSFTVDKQVLEVSVKVYQHVSGLHECRDNDTHSPEWFIHSTVGPIISRRWAQSCAESPLSFWASAHPALGLDWAKKAHSWAWLMCWTSPTQTLLTPFYKPLYPTSISATIFLSQTRSWVMTFWGQISRLVCAT